MEKPARYTGGEFNSVEKDVDKVALRYGFCFPDIYDVGMSHLGSRIMYHLINSRQDVYCERAFAPWIDMEQQLRDNNLSLFTLETATPLAQMDVLGFTLQYEMSYTNLLNMLLLSNIPLRSCQRTEQHPIICAGGPCACNPEPLAPFIDFFVIGEGEVNNDEILDLCILYKQKQLNRRSLLEKLALVEGVYVPEFYDVEYDGQLVKGIYKNNPNAKDRVKRVYVSDFDSCFYPSEMIVPFNEIVHDRIMMELFRGCYRGCRFCQAGMIYRPVRCRTPQKLVEIAKKTVLNTGYEEISLTSLSTGDYDGLEQLCDGLAEFTKEKRVSLSLPSLRLDNFSLSIMEKAGQVRRTSLTFAPEGGTQRMRDIINKNIQHEDLINAAKLAFENGYSTLKLYFMVGLPFETDEDVEAIAGLSQEVVQIYREVGNKKRPLKLTISSAAFVPKAFTPFQWAQQCDPTEFERKQQLIRAKIRSKAISFNWHHSALSLLEGVFARGDRRLADVLERAVKLGCRLDGWSEHFDYEKWLKAFDMPIEWYTRKRDLTELLPWEVIDIGVSRKFLENEYKNAQNGVTTPNCRQKCSNCGVIKGGCFK